MVATQTDDLHPEHRSGRATRRSFLFRAVGLGGASFALMLAQACQSQGAAPPSYSGGSAPAMRPGLPSGGPAELPPGSSPEPRCVTVSRSAIGLVHLL